MKRKSGVCAFGNAASETLTASIYPFILRGVSRVGVNAKHPVPGRGEVWPRMMAGTAGSPTACIRPL